jgi:hypothetical protein
MDMRTPVHTGGFASATAPKGASTTANSTPADPAQFPSTIIDSSIESDQIAIGALQPTKPPTVLDRLLHEDLLHKCGGLDKSVWAK